MFSSLLDEALVAEHFLLRGYDVSTVARTGLQTPDLRVVGEGVDMAIEAYSPREWLEIEEWTGRLEQYSDVPWNYNARVRTRVAQRSGPTAAPAAPWEIAAMLEATKETVFDALSRDVLTALSSELLWWTRTYEYEESRFETIVNL